MKAWRRLENKDKYYKLAAEANTHYKEQCEAYKAVNNSSSFFPKIAESSKKISKRSVKPQRKDKMLQKDQMSLN